MQQFPVIVVVRWWSACNFTPFYIQTSKSCFVRTETTKSSSISGMLGGGRQETSWKQTIMNSSNYNKLQPNQLVSFLHALFSPPSGCFECRKWVMLKIEKKPPSVCFSRVQLCTFGFVVTVSTYSLILLLTNGWLFTVKVDRALFTTSSFAIKKAGRLWRRIKNRRRQIR